MPEIAAADNMIVVKVDKVLKAAKTLGDYTGRDITVLLRQPEKAQVGQQMAFFTNGWLYGRSIAVKEVGVLPVEDIARTEMQVAEGIRVAADRDLQRRIAQAELVVVGTVRGIDDVPMTRKQGISEHDPLWRQAVITVQSVEKGKLPEKTVVVWFPSSQDVMWYKSPKFSVNQEAIWILHKHQTEALPPEAKEAYTGLDQDDIHPVAELNRMRRLVKQIR
jgi:predicted transcriptional regulator